jgi:hypothetical protein
MYQNTYDHDESEPDYRRHISNIAYRFKFDVIYEDEQVLKIENGKTTVLTTSAETPRNTLCWKAWMILQEEYGYSGG